MLDNTGTYEGRIYRKGGMKNPKEINSSSVVLCAVLTIYLKTNKQTKTKKKKKTKTHTQKSHKKPQKYTMEMYNEDVLQ